ncbi:MAG: hypothetical protein KBI44_05135, partial [Thermoanaerobaculia bacterium]|nr:hypothetical protein [Thermoanaerobaculia bacterium]
MVSNLHWRERPVARIARIGTGAGFNGVSLNPTMVHEAPQDVCRSTAHLHFKAKRVHIANR